MSVAFYCGAKVFNSPGPAYIAYKYKPHTRPVVYSEHIGNYTQEVADFRSLNKGLESLLLKHTGVVDLHSSSMVLLNQVSGIWQCRDEREMILVDEARYWLNQFERVNLIWVHDRLNEALAVLDELPSMKTVQNVYTIVGDDPKKYVVNSLEIE